MKKGILLILTMVSFNLHAAVYKCTLDGVETYGQDPCEDGAQPITVTPPAKMHSGTETRSGEELIRQCIEWFKVAGDYKDPDSIKTKGAYLDWMKDDSGARRVLMIRVNAKNSYGGYAGGKFEPCFLNHSGTKLSEYQYLIYK